MRRHARVCPLPTTTLHTAKRYTLKSYDPLQLGQATWDATQLVAKLAT